MFLHTPILFYFFLFHSYIGRFEINYNKQLHLIGNVINQVSPFVTDSIWLGKANQLRTRLSLNGENDPATTQKAKQVEQWQSDGNIKQLHSQFKDYSLIKWKDSIKKVVGLKVSTKAGMDR